MKIPCSIGVFAHNEAVNILHLLRALDTQKLEHTSIEEIIVVSSASTDGTDTIVRDFCTTHQSVRLITQAKREGKASAINLFLKEASSDIAIIISGDVIPGPNTIELLVSSFIDPKIGATGGRPIPVNSDGSLMSYAVHLLWRLHHRMALKSPKLGEMIAFRKIMNTIPPDSAVDEASIEAIIKAAGYSLRYIPEAIIHNKGPENLRDYILQRRRIQNGHLWLKRHQHYEVVSQDSSTLFSILWAEIAADKCQLPKLMLVVLLECCCRLLGSWDFYIRGKNPFAWEISRSTKQVR